jgi:hypothetical protein
MVAGTDAGTSGVVTGFSLTELELLVDAGLNEEAHFNNTFTFRMVRNQQQGGNC